MPRPRRINTRTIRKTIYAVVEGDKTEVQYVNFLRTRMPGAHGVEIIPESPGSARETLYKRARQIIKDSDQDTEVWIFCDVDDEGKALSQLTRQNFKGRERLRWAVSNPEFALWLVMHFQDCTKWEHRSVYASLAKGLGVATGKNGKGIDLTKLSGRASEALRNAAAARKRHLDAERYLPDNNPQSDVDGFLHHIVDTYNERVPVGYTKLSVEKLY